MNNSSRPEETIIANKVCLNLYLSQTINCTILINFPVVKCDEWISVEGAGLSVYRAHLQGGGV